MERDDWVKLLSEFRDAYARLGQRDFHIAVMQCDIPAPSPKIGSMKHGGSVTVRRQDGEATSFVFLLHLAGREVDAVWNRWDELAGMAGAMVCSEWLPEIELLDEGNAQCVWCLFLRHRLRRVKAFTGSFASDEDVRRLHVTTGETSALEHRGVLSNPFGASVRAIQMMLSEMDGARPNGADGEERLKEQPAAKRKGKGKGRIGRPSIVSDTAKLARYCKWAAEWKTGKYKTYADCAKSFSSDVTAEEIRKAVDANRKGLLKRPGRRKNPKR